MIMVPGFLRSCQRREGFFKEEDVEIMTLWTGMKAGVMGKAGRGSGSAGDSRGTGRAKDRTEDGLAKCHGAEGPPCISTQYPPLSPEDNRSEAKGKPWEAAGRHGHNKQMCLN